MRRREMQKENKREEEGDWLNALETIISSPSRLLPSLVDTTRDHDHDTENGVHDCVYLATGHEGLL